MCTTGFLFLLPWTLAERMARVAEGKRRSAWKPKKSEPLFNAEGASPKSRAVARSRFRTPSIYFPIRIGATPDATGWEASGTPVLPIGGVHIVRGLEGCIERRVEELTGWLTWRRRGQGGQRRRCPLVSQQPQAAGTYPVRNGCATGAALEPSCGTWPSLPHGPRRLGPSMGAGNSSSRAPFSAYVCR